MATCKDWVRKLKVGDIVFVCGRWGKTLNKVEKITPKGFIKVAGSLFNPDTGFERSSDTWNSCVLQQATKENVEEYMREKYIKHIHHFLQNLKNQDISYEQAVEISKIFNISDKSDNI